VKQLIDQLKRHEGLRLKPYRCTAGKLTIGYGRNIEDKGISEGEAESMLWADVAEVRRLLEKQPVYPNLDEIRKSVLVNMGFMGVSKLMQFKRMWEALAYGDFDKAAEEMLDSKWAKQVGARATELAEQMKTGEWL